MRLAWLAVLAAMAQAQPAPAPGAHPPAPADLVRIDVIARDAQGRPIETLQPSDFALTEDGTPQTIAGVRLVRVDPAPSAGAVPAVGTVADERLDAVEPNTRLLAIYLDEYFVAPAHTAAVKAALHRLVDDDLGPRDLVAILRPLDSLLTIRLTRDHVALDRAIDAFEGRRGDYTPRTDFERAYIVSNRERADSQRAQSTWSTLNALTLHLANLRAGRSSVLLVSEQADPVIRRRGFEGLPTSTSVTRTANRSNVSVYVFDPRTAAERAASPDEGPNLLRVLADDTDGALFGIDAADAGFHGMLDDASSYYLVTYQSVRNRDGLFHAVVVSVKRRGVMLRARAGYWAPTPDEIQRANRLAHAGDPLPPIKLEPIRHKSALIRPWFGVARGDAGRLRMTFVWEPVGPVPGDRRVKVPARIQMRVVGADGVQAFDGMVDDRSAAVFDVPPGRVTFTMSIEDAASDAIDSDVRDVLVRDLRGAVVLGTPEVFRGRTALDLRELRAANAVPVAAREFSRAEHLLVRVPVYAPSPTVTASLVSSAKQVMRQLAVQQASASGGLAQIDLPLASLPPGDYSVAIAAKAAAGSAKESLDFRVAD